MSLKKNLNEIIWNIVNSLLAGALIFLGALTNGNIDEKTILIAGMTAGIIAISQFRDYWKTQEKEYTGSLKLFKFI